MAVTYRPRFDWRSAMQFKCQVCLALPSYPCRTVEAMRDGAMGWSPKYAASYPHRERIDTARTHYLAL